ncbi:acyltransferase family protein [Terricaulis sp.]|uniref:acyltransferase family protein n=1 Tax=Terricaulis sp. TaxID=2768686 RepID=UPI0037843B05
MSLAEPATPQRAALRDGYRADIQGLRAIAVLSVVLYHANEDLLGGGFIGVDIFFVISGYLITGILAREIAEGRNSIPQFYRRRVRRLFPALFLMLAAVLGLGWWLLQPAALRELGRTVVSTVFFVSNFDFLALTNYFGGEADAKPLLHTWSLAVEEQFYIVFPVLLALIWRFGRGVMLGVLVALFVASVGLSIWLTAMNPSAAFYIAPTRAFELLTGALLALNFVPALKTPGARDGVSIAGLALILVSFALINNDTAFPGFAALAPCIGAGLMLHAGRDGTSRAGRWISSPVFLFFGAISYSLYLWHWPLLVYAQLYSAGETPDWLVIAAVTAAIAAAYISWRFVEQPFLKGKATASHVLAVGAAAMAVSAAAGVALMSSDGFPNRFPPQARALFAAADDFNPRRVECHQGDNGAIPWAQACSFGANAPPTAVVWGDSFAAELAVAVGERLAARGESALQVSATVCPAALGYASPEHPLCAPRNADAIAHIEGDPRIRTVVLIANLAAYSDEKRPMIEAGYRRTIQRLRAAGKRIVLVMQVPIMPSDPPEALGMIVARGGDVGAYGASRAEHIARSAWADGLLRNLAGEGVTIVEPADIVCDLEFCRALANADAAPLYYNRSHLSLAGARLVADRIPLD